jgi:hypothetical protein
VILITDALGPIHHAERAMKNNDAPYKIFRILRDGEELFVAGRADLREAKACVDKFLGCWPGKYSIRGPESFNVICRPTW